ncbi:MAG TPA: diguanylate cyclase [Chthonomonadaceae bacterium]|nr:diguanylate cyclase [Chthonomonadaceae bacterium]
MTPDEIDALNHQVWERMDNDARQALAQSQAICREAEAIGYQRGLAHALLNNGECHAVLLNYVCAMADLFQAQRLYQELGDASGEAAVLNAIGKIQFRLNDYEAARDCYTRSLEIRRQTGDRRGEASALNNIGLVCFDMARYLEAHDYHLQSQQLHEEAGNPTGAARAINNLGLVYEKLGDMTSALDCHLRSLAIKESLGNLSGVCASLNNLGDLYCRMGDYERALDYNRQGLEMARRTNHRYHEAMAWINMGGSHQALGDLEQAMTCYNQGLAVLEGAGDGFSRAETLLNIADNYTQRDLHDQALDYLQQALALGEALNSQELISRAHQALAALYEARHDSLSALEHYKAYHQASAALFAEEQDHRRQVLEIKAEIDRVRRESEIRRLKNVELAQAYRDLEQANVQKSEMLTILQQQAQELERLTQEDALTGMSNRRHLDQRIAQEYERAQRFDHDLTLALVDIDNFKKINDAHSHLVGDEVLRTVARLLKKGCRSVDVVGRYGGEEFLLLLVETAPPDCHAMCERLRASIEGYEWAQILPGLVVTISIGMATSREAALLEKIIALADERLYKAKREGKNQVCAPSLR